MKFKDKVIYKLLSLIKRQNRMVIKGKSFIHPSVKLTSALISGEVFINEGCQIINGVSISAEKPVKIGRYTSLNGPNTDIICAINPVNIGSFCSIARSVNIQEFNHRFDRLTSYLIHKNIFKENVVRDIYSNGSVEIGNDVWVGTQCVILGGAKIGDGAVIGANSVVSGVIPPYAIAVGSPAKVIKYRFDAETIELLLHMKWWDWPLEKIKANRWLFDTELSKENLQKLWTKKEDL